jgi:hypothetical protein
LNILVGCIEFAHQLYNFLSVLGEEWEATMMPIQWLNEKILDYKDQYSIKVLIMKKSKRKDGHKSDSASAGMGAGVGGTSAADSKDFRAHGYEVKLDVMVDAKGGTFEPLFKVWQLFYTYYRLC